MKITASIAILGGTFDPIHNGHLAIARAVYEELQPKEVRFIPCYLPAHRTQPIASAEERLEMVKLAVQGEKKFIADDREIQRKGVSYMIDTLKSLHAEFPAAPLYLILSTDAFSNFHHWHQYQDILNYAHLIVTQRPGYRLPENIAALKTAGNILLLDFTGPDISATAIRAQIAKGKAPIKLLPKAVWEYIQHKKLYI